MKNILKFPGIVCSYTNDKYSPECALEIYELQNVHFEWPRMNIYKAVWRIQILFLDSLKPDPVKSDLLR